METKHVKPNPGIVVRDPVSLRTVPEDGAIVPWTSYWQHRVAEGGLYVVEEDQNDAPQKSAARKTKSHEKDSDQ